MKALMNPLTFPFGALLVACGWFGSVSPAQAGVEPEPFHTAYFAPFELGPEESARLNVVFPPGTYREDAAPSVEMRFFDAEGSELVSERHEVRPGAAVSVEVEADFRTARTLWAEVRRIPAGQADATLNGVPVPVLEIVDEAGVRFLLNPALLQGFDPKPEPSVASR